MLRIAICDDMLEYIEEIKQLLVQWSRKTTPLNIEVFNDGDSLLKSHKATPFDIIFLDVVMPLLNGIETAKEIRQNDKSTHIVFISSERSFAVDSYSVKADNYLLKPICTEDFYNCIQEIYEKLQTDSRSIPILTSSATYRVKINDIAYLEAQNKYVFVCLADGRALQSNQALYTYEEQLALSDVFFKCHRSYIVNIQHIDTYTTKFIQLRSGIQIPISRGCQKQFENAYFDFLFGKVGERL